MKAILEDDPLTTHRWPKSKCVICRKNSLPNDYRCKKCSDDYFREMIPVWKAQGYPVLNGDKY